MIIKGIATVEITGVLLANDCIAADETLGVLRVVETAVVVIEEVTGVVTSNIVVETSDIAGGETLDVLIDEDIEVEKESLNSVLDSVDSVNKVLEIFDTPVTGFETILEVEEDGDSDLLRSENIALEAVTDFVDKRIVTPSSVSSSDVTGLLEYINAGLISSTVEIGTLGEGEVFFLNFNEGAALVDLC